MIRAAIYMRVSTDRQVQEGDSIPAQRDALRKYIDDHEDMVLAGEYLDDGVSGTKADRDELVRLLDDVKAGKIDQIIFTKLDRWFRSIKLYVATQDVLDNYNVTWIAIWEPVYNTSTPAGRLIINQMLSIAQFEAENTGQRIRQVFEYKKSQGEVCSGNVTPGYRIQDKHLVIDEDLAPAVREVFEHYANTGKLFETVRMAADGLPKTKQGMKTLLRRRTYIGEHHGRPGFCEPLIDPNLFERVQLQLGRNIKRNQKRTYLFSGIVRCAECGRVMASGSEVKDGKRYVHYRCPGHFQSPIKTCENMKVLLEHKLEEYLLDNLAPLVAEYRSHAEAVKAPARDMKRQRDAIETKLSRLKELYVNGLIDLPEYRQDKERYEAELAALDVPATPSVSPLDGFEPVEGINVYHELDKEGKRLFWRRIIREIRFDKSRNLDIIFL